MALDIQNHAGRLVGPGGQAHVLCVVHDLGNVSQADRIAILEGDDELGVFGRGLELVVGVDGGGTNRAVKTALGLVDVGCRDGGSHIIERQTQCRQGGGIGLNAHSGPAPAGNGDQADTGHL